MSELHRRSVDVLLDVLDAADQVDKLTAQQIQELLREVADVLTQMMRREAERNNGSE